MMPDECLERGLVRKAAVPPEEAASQLKIAENYLKKAELICERDLYDMSFLAAYISIFHSARALLYRKGYKERSHFCLFEVVHSEFGGDPEIRRLAEVSQSYREMRHLVQYEGSLCSESTSKEAIKDARAFLRAARRAIG